jgi:hypothetical protein
MALFRACSNSQVTLNLEAAARKLELILPANKPINKKPGKLAPLRGSIREAVINTLAASDEELPPRQIHHETARRLGWEVRRHTIDTSLAKVVADPTVPIVKAGPGKYRYNVDAEIPIESNALGDQVVAVLNGAKQPMRAAEVWAAIEGGQNREVSYDSVAAMLSRLAKHKASPVVRAKPGQYWLVA